MNLLDSQYRALLNYRQITTSNTECNSLRAAIAETDTEKDKITVKRSYCTIEEDWVNAIEAGLVHVEKAIKEERQFIRSNGEVVPIEKVKHVSKESVEHLAKHSNLITRYEEGEDIIPDQLYTVERLSDYAVYENRFLYMLLCCLRDFVTLRYNAILDITNKYEATADFSKKISTGKEKLNYTVSMHDVKRDDPYLKENNPAKAIIDRIDLILKAVLAFLATPLMESVAKSPMIKPPITKTNVLKMNNNFKGAVALYDYIVSYDKPGYTIETETTTISPFRSDLADEMAEAGGLVSFLTYEYGLGIKQYLKDSYSKEEERRRREDIKKREEKIASMKRKLKSSEVSIEDYVLTLEKQLRALEGESKRAEELAEAIAVHEENERILKEHVEELDANIAELEAEIVDERNRHYEEIRALKEAHENEMHELITKHNEAIAALRDEMREMERAHAEEMEALRLETAERISNIEATARERISSVEATARARISEARAETAEATAKYEEALEAKRASEARVKAIGGVDREYTSREDFTELENEYKAFTKIYKEQWAKTKKLIRQNHLNMKNIKGQEEKSESSD